VLTGVSAIAGAFGKPKTQTQTTPSYTPEQMDMQRTVAGELKGYFDNGADFTPMKNAAIAGVNDKYATIQDKMNADFAGRGFGKSGKLALDTERLDIARMGDVGRTEAEYAQKALDYRKAMLDLASRFGFAGGGSTTTQSGGGGVAGALGAGAETATTLYALNHFLGGGNGSGLNLDIDHTPAR
jgi:hypothetical protein